MSRRAAGDSPDIGPLETYIPIDDARLFVRAVGDGPPVVVVHGGPTFDHNYFLPELDRLCDLGRLVYYDQRGRGRSYAIPGSHFEVVGDCGRFSFREQPDAVHAAVADLLTPTV